MEPSPVQSSAALLASPLQRIGAALADLAVLLGAYLLMFYLLLAVLPTDIVDRALLVMATACSTLYLVVLWGRGQTFGKRLFAIKVVGPDGRRPGLLRAALRFVGYAIASLPFKIGLLPILWDPLRRGWHDQIAGTLVVKEDASGIPARRPDTEPVTPDESAPGTIRWRDFAMLPVFAAATAVLTWPVVARLPARFPSNGGDANVFIWSLWWVRKALSDPRLSVFETDYIFWPEKVSLRLHSFSLFNCALGVPLQKFLSLPLTYSLLLLLALCLTAFAAYLLGKYTTGSALGGLLVGLFFGFCPYMIWHAWGHPDLVSSEWTVLYVLLLVIVLKKAQTRHALLAAVALVLTGLCAWHHLTHAAVFTAVFAAAWLAIHRKGIARRIVLIGVAAPLSLAVLAVWLVPMERDFASGRYGKNRSNAQLRADIMSLDLGSMLVPPPYHPIFGRWTSSIYSGKLHPGPGAEQVGYLGWTVLGLALVGVWESRRRRAHLPWLATAVAGILLAFGFTLRIFGLSGFPLWLLLAAGGPPGSGMHLPIVPSLGVQTAMMAASGSPYSLHSLQGVDMPFALLWKIGGIMRLANTPCRFVVMANLCLAILAAVGALRLAHLLGARWGKWAGGALVAAVACAVMFEYLIAPRFPTEGSAMHPFYGQLAQNTDCAAIVELSMAWLDDLHFQRAQTIHGKRLYGGRLSRTPDDAEDFVQRHPLLSKALKVWPGGSPGYSMFGLSSFGADSMSEQRLFAYRSDLRALAQTGCCYIVVHKDLIEPRSLRQASQLLAGALKLPIALDDGELTVYRVPPLSEVRRRGP